MLECVIMEHTDDDYVDFSDLSILETEPELNLGPIARLTPRNLKAVLMGVGMTPGIYLANDLYAEYLVKCREVGAQPISKNAFGRSLSGQGCTPCTKRADGKQQRAWQIPRSRFPDILAGEPWPEFSSDSQHPTIAHPEGT